MSERLLLGLTAVLVLGVVAQWFSWAARQPAILFLLLFGFLAGPATGWLDPDALLGNLLLPLVSISVAVILFEGGLSLKLAELRSVGREVRNLVTIGALVSWVVTAAAARWLAGLPADLAILLGAILVVTGPTVVGPLLRTVRPRRSVGSILRWEGILIDPVGAVLAVLVFEAIHVERISSRVGGALLGLGLTAAVGLALGLAGAGLLVLLFRRHLVPDFLQNPVTLMTVVGALVAADHLRSESGLLAVTVMGVALANQKQVVVLHIVEFKENLTILLVSSLFILLSARLDMRDFLAAVRGGGIPFLAAVLLVARPASVLASTFRSGLSWSERAFLAAVAPRGIVAAAVSSVFALELARTGHAGAESIVSLTFLVIVGTVVVYGTLAGPIARRLGVASPHAQGILFVGAQGWVRALARTLAEQRGRRVLLVDTNWEHVRAARMDGLEAHFGNALAESVLDELDLAGIGRVLAVTPSDGINGLVALHYSRHFGRENVFQLPASGGRKGEAAAHLRGRTLFGGDWTEPALAGRFGRGWRFKATPLGPEFEMSAYRERYGEDAAVLFVADEEAERLDVVTGDGPVEARPGQLVIGLVPDGAAG